MDSPTATSTNSAPWAAIVAGCLLLTGGTLYMRMSQSPDGFDDAYITYRYAQNLAEGHGLVFNPGERVEGYSTFLYALLMTLGQLILGPKTIYSWSLAINILSACGALCIAVHAVGRRAGSTAAWLAAFTLGIFPSIWIAIWSGLETMLVVFLAMVLWRITIWEHAAKWNVRRLAATALVTVLLVISRADAFIIAIAIGTHSLVLLDWRPGLTVLAMTISTFAAHAAGRLAYYGYPFPNTYYAKVSGDLIQRVEYGWAMFTTLGQVHPYALITLAATTVGILVVILNHRSPLRIARFEILFPIAWFAYWIYVGGDIFGDRMLLCLIPLLTVFMWTRAFPSHIPRWTRVAIALALVLHATAFLPPPQFPEAEDSHVRAGLHLAELYPDAVIAVDAAGKIPYASGLATIDTMGLCDAHIAHTEPKFEFVPGHNKSDMDYVIQREPDVIIGKMTIGTPNFTIGPTPEQYEPKYELAKLMRLGVAGPNDPVTVNVRGLSNRELRDYQFSGYDYGILERVDMSAP